MRQCKANNRMTCFVICGFFLLISSQNHGTAFRTHHHLILGVFKIDHSHNRTPNACGHQRGLIHKVGQIRARKSRCTAGDQTQIHVWAQWRFARMNSQDFFTALDVWIGHGHLTVKATRAQQGWVQNITAVCCGQDDDTFVGFKTVHFNQQLVQCLFAFIVSTAIACTTVTSNGVDFVDKDDTWRVLFRLFEHVTHTRCAHADKHFNKVRT